MSLFLTETNAGQYRPSGLALRAYRLRCRRDGATGARRRMLGALSDAYLAFGLAAEHERYQSPQAAGIREEGLAHLQRARDIAIMGACV